MKTIPLVACGVFRWEFEKILPELEKEIGAQFAPHFLPPALDVSDAEIETGITDCVANECGGSSCAFLYGCMCHSKMGELAAKSGSVFPSLRNCAEIIMGADKKKELDAEGNFYYLTAGGLRLWKEIYYEKRGWDDVDGRMNFAGIEKIIVLDTGVLEISDESLFEFFEFTQVPVEVLKINLDHFKSVVKEIVMRLCGLCG